MKFTMTRDKAISVLSRVRGNTFSYSPFHRNRCRIRRQGHTFTEWDRHGVYNFRYCTHCTLVESEYDPLRKNRDTLKGRYCHIDLFAI